MDQADEVQLRAGRSRDLEVDRLALLSFAGDAGVARPVDDRGCRLADAVLEIGELRRRVRIRICAVSLTKLFADLALEELLE